MPEAIFDIDFIKKGDHVFCLVLGVIQMLNSVKDDNNNNLMRHDACILQKFLVALLNPLYRCLQHVLGFAIHAHAYRHLYSPLLCSAEEGD